MIGNEGIIDDVIPETIGQLIYSVKNVTQSLVVASQIWGFTVFLCFVSLYTKILWILHFCPDKTRHLNTLPWVVQNNDRLFQAIQLITYFKTLSYN